MIAVLLLMLMTEIPNVSEIVPQKLAEVSGVMAHLKYQRFTTVEKNNVMFPEEYNLKSAAASDPLMQRYLAIPEDLRKNDFYLLNTSGTYWDSETKFEDKAVKFRCGFIVHLERQQDLRTKIEIFEYLPQVLVGKKFSLTGHHGPGTYDDVRMVPATTVDRVNLLEAIKQAIKKPQPPPKN